MNKDAFNRIFQDVRAFHVAAGQPCPTEPTFQEPGLVSRRSAWIDSELQELDDATTDENLTEQVDAYLDIIYFGIGGLVECGVLPGELWDLVAKANYPGKLWPDGTMHKNEQGKVLKPAGWVAPDAEIAAAINRQRQEKPLG